MHIVAQENRWTCLPCALATAIGRPLEDILRVIGHDGSLVIFPDLEEPLNRRAFQITEIIFAAYLLGWNATLFEREVEAGVDAAHCYTLENPEWGKFIDDIMSNSFGVLCGVSHITGTNHAVAWDGRVRLCYDPNGMIYPIEKYEILSYIALEKSQTRK